MDKELKSDILNQQKGQDKPSISQKEEMFYELAGLYSKEVDSATKFQNRAVAITFFLKTFLASLTDCKEGDQEELKEHFRMIGKALNELKPLDAIEGMLMSRLIALHLQGMHFLSCANWNDSKEAKDAHVNRSTKVFRLYNETLETLMKYRRRGEQRVVVQHVNVNDGGKAIVGSTLVSEGGKEKNRE